MKRLGKAIIATIIIFASCIAASVLFDIIYKYLKPPIWVWIIIIAIIMVVYFYKMESKENEE